jgi:hypothetical protein
MDTQTRQTALAKLAHKHGLISPDWLEFLLIATPTESRIADLEHKIEGFLRLETQPVIDPVIVSTPEPAKIDPPAPVDPVNPYDPSALESADPDDPFMIRLIDMLSYTADGIATYDPALINQSRIDTLYFIHTLGKGLVPQRVIDDVRDRAAAILIADAYTPALDQNDRATLEQLAHPSNYLVLQVIDQIRDRRLNGVLNTSGPKTKPSADKFVSAATEDFVKHNRETRLPYYAQKVG